MDMGVHCIDLLCWLLGEVTQVSALVGTLTHAYEVDDSATLLLQFAGGAHAVVEAFFNIPDEGAVNALEIYGTQGCLLAQGTIGQGAGGSLRGYLASPRAPGYDAQQARHTDETLRPIPYTQVNTYRAEIEQFIQCILAGQDAPIAAEDAARALDVVEAAYAAARSGCAVPVRAA
jgi:predicted dehydrogenase